MNYRARIAVLRAERDRIRAERSRELERIQSELRQARAERDAEIKRLHHKGAVAREIAAAVGCSASLVWEVLDAERHERYNRRRREHWHVYTGGRAG